MSVLRARLEDEMRKSKFTEEQIIAALKLAEAGGKVDEVCRKLGVTVTTFYRWKRKYGGLEVNDAKKLKALEEENRRLKQMVADQALDLQALKLVISKKF
jgi:putative transposase